MGIVVIILGFSGEYVWDFIQSRKAKTDDKFPYPEKDIIKALINTAEFNEERNKIAQKNK